MDIILPKKVKCLIISTIIMMKLMLISAGLGFRTSKFKRT